MNKSEEQEIKKEFQLERVILFSDAVFAIIITIMVLDIRLPEGIRHMDFKEAKHSFLELIPKTMAYGLSFFLVARFWLSHLRMFSHLRDYDNTLLVYNLFCLFSVSLFPFAVTLISGNISPETPAYGWSIYIYMSIILLTALSQTLTCRYLVLNRDKLCFEPEKIIDVLKYRALRYNFILIPVTICLLVAISFLNYPGYYYIAALVVYGVTMGRLNRKYYPKSNDGPVIVSLFNTIRKRTSRKSSNKQINKT
ncbi:MAG TPA: TMEM175 family protein [Mucilaginibacter sp.]|nr:TMEM175 family protein [Mucilaginibacter sp.]